nr:MAG TPA: hypothetical protein [Caudoviricetes sp.]
MADYQYFLAGVLYRCSMRLSRMKCGIYEISV